MSELYKYKAKCTRIIDGDTVELSIDLGFDITVNINTRLAGIDTPEIRTKNELEKKAGNKVKDILSSLLIGKELLVKTYKDSDKYGRYICDIFVDNMNVNEFLVNMGYAFSYNGGARESWTDDKLKYIINLDIVET